MGWSTALLTVLLARDIKLHNGTVDRILNCPDQDQLRVWIHRAATATTAGDIFRETQGWATVLLRTVLSERGIELSADDWERVTECVDIDEFSIWVRRAVTTATTADDLFAP